MASKTKQKLSFKGSVEDSFTSYISNAKNQIESELFKLISGFSNLNLHPQMEYAVLSQGKRLRPLLTILSAESVGGDRNKIMPLALAFELMHTATLVHDDVIDRDEMRRGKLAVHQKWSVSDAILTGDSLIALAVDLASGYGEAILKTVAQSALMLCDGAYKDVSFSLDKVTEELYFRKIKEKSASLFRAAIYCGALAAKGIRSEVKSLSAFGENFGIAYQLRDDILDLSLKETPVSKDLKNGTINLPLIHSFVTSSTVEKKNIETKLRAIKKQDPLKSYENAKDLLQFIISKGSIDYCEKKVDEHLRRAVDSLSPLRNSEYKNHLIEMTKALKTWS